MGSKVFSSLRHPQAGVCRCTAAVGFVGADDGASDREGSGRLSGREEAGAAVQEAGGISV